VTLTQTPSTGGMAAALWFIALALVVLAGAYGFSTYKTWFADDAAAAIQPGDSVATRLDDVSSELRALRLAFCQISDLSTGECSGYFTP